MLKGDMESSFITQHSNNRDQGITASKRRLKIISMATPISFLLLKPLQPPKRLSNFLH